MRIVVDAMGGDDAPEAVVQGAVEAVSEVEAEIILVGPEQKIKSELEKCSYDGSYITIESASEVIGMEDSPARALKKKKDSSIVVGAELVANGQADAFVSAGNTGAVMAAGTLKIGRITGVKRPAIASVFPALKGETLVLDIGANVDSKPEHLVQQTVMGQIYASEILHISNPKVGLLSIGEEKKKGNQLTKEVYPRLEEEESINFVGNVEGRDIFTGEYDVVVTDGFVGNVVLKTTEGVASALMKIIKEEIGANLRSKLGGLLLKPALQRVAKRMDYKEYGGAPLLGVKGTTIIAHGSSDSRAIVNAIKTAQDSIQVELVDLIEQKIKERTDK